MTILAKESDYGFGIYELFPALAPLENSTDLYEIQSDYAPIDPGKNRSLSQQAVYQLVALVSTLAISVSGGILTGFILKFRIWDPFDHDYSCGDANFWKVSDNRRRQSTGGE